MRSNTNMKIVTQFPRVVREIENTWITLSDGTRLAARIWLPKDAVTHPVPGILEFLPYRKSDGTSARDAMMYPYLAGHGYACVRVDMRGAGEADGILLDEYLEQEQNDALEVIAWIAAQPWCDGGVGMCGISWSGFNALQVAARRPPALKAIITMCSTDDRYADDVHYTGGCIGYDALPWASIMFNINAAPPDPRFVGERWRELWLARMAQTPPYIDAWLAHQTRDAYWRHGSVCENYAEITCPVYAIGGWVDGYTNAIPRLLAGLPGPRKGLIGPWSHTFPNHAEPGPAIGFLQEVLRWWDHWLKGIDSGIMDEPMLRAWIQDSVPPATFYSERPGRWVAETQWPSAGITPQLWRLDSARGLHLSPRPTQPAMPPAVVTLHTRLETGLDCGAWCPYGAPGDWAADQSAEDARSGSFTSEPLAEALDILGAPVLTLTLSSDKPYALVAARLCDVAPGGESLLVSVGLLNLTHRNGHDRVDPLTPGERTTVTIKLNDCGHRLAAGHRWRISISPSYWPHAWPSPEPATLSVFVESSHLSLPARPANARDMQLPAFGEPEASAPMAYETVRDPKPVRMVEHDRLQNTHRLRVCFDYGDVRQTRSGLTGEAIVWDTYEIKEGDPLSAKVVCERLGRWGGEGWSVRVVTRSEMTCDALAFHVINRMDAYESINGAEIAVFGHSWQTSVARNGA